MKLIRPVVLVAFAFFLALLPVAYLHAQGGGSSSGGSAGSGAGGTAGARFGGNPNGLGTGGVSSGGTGGGMALPANNGIAVPGPGNAAGTLGNGRRYPGGDAASSVRDESFSSGGLRAAGPRPSGAATAPAWFGGSDIRPERKSTETIPNRANSNGTQNGWSSSQKTVPPSVFLSPSDIAVLDVSKVMRSSRSFQAKMSELKKKIIDLEKSGGGGQAALRATARRLKELPVNSDDFVRLQLQFVAKNTETQANFAREQKMIVAEESIVYANMYEEIRKATATIAQKNGVRLVLRYDSEAIDLESRDAVMRGLARAVVFQDDLDITDAVIALIDAK